MEPTPRAAKFRQAAFAYLHVTVLYEATAYVMWREGMFHRGPPLLWLILGGVVGVGISLALYRWHNPWLPRAIWLVHGLRLPALIRQAFVVDAASALSPSFYLTAIVVVVANLWMLARAGWDL